MRQPPHHTYQHGPLRRCQWRRTSASGSCRAGRMRQRRLPLQLAQPLQLLLTRRSTLRLLGLLGPRTQRLHFHLRCP